MRVSPAAIMFAHDVGIWRHACSSATSLWVLPRGDQLGFVVVAERQEAATTPS
jgi:hypothetical protein